MSHGISASNNTKSNTETVERFVSIQAGQYWQALDDDLHKQIAKGDILLLTQVDHVDNAPHTMHVRFHPSKVESWSKEAKFYIDKFLSSFSHVDEAVAAKSRDADLAAVQGRIAAEQQSMNEACADTKLLDSIISQEEAKRQISRGEANLPTVQAYVPQSAVSAIQSQQLTALIDTQLTADSIDAIKSVMANQSSIIQKRSEWIQAKTKKIQDIVARTVPFYEEKAAVALALTSEMRLQIDKLMQGVESLNLYTLKDVEILSVSSGVGADRSVKVTVMQDVLFMDEELAVYADVNEKFDFSSRGVFFNELATNPELVNQIFTTERCVVGIATTRHDIVYEGISDMDKYRRQMENKRVFLLTRDGHNINCIVSPDVGHQFTGTLFPSQGQLDRPFTGFDGSRITFESINFTQSLSRFEKMAIIYKRLLILLCGLDHKHKILGDFYDGPASLDFVSMKFQEQYFRFVYDQSGDGLISGERPESFESWVEDMNKGMGSGSRVLAMFYKLAEPESIPFAFERESHHNSRGGRSLRMKLKSGEDYSFGILQRSKNELFLPVELRRNHSKDCYNSKLNISRALESRSGRTGFSLLCLDRVEPEPLQWYLHDRKTRVLNVAGIRLLKSALTIIKGERPNEQHIREQLMQALLDAHIANPIDAARYVTEAIAIWRCSKNGASLTETIKDSKDMKKLLDTLYSLTSKSVDRTDQIIAAEEGAGRLVLRVTLDTSGFYVAYSSPLPNERDDRLEPHAWVNRTRYRVTKDDIKPQPSTMVLFTSVENAEQVKYEAAEDITREHIHVLKKIAYHRYNEKQKAFDIPSPVAALSVFYDACVSVDSFKSLVNNYLSVRRASMKNDSITEPRIYIEIGCFIKKDYDGFMQDYRIMLRCLEAYELLSWVASHHDESIQQSWSRAVKSVYQNERYWANSIDQAVKKAQAGQSLTDLFQVVCAWRPDSLNQLRVAQQAVFTCTTIECGEANAPAYANHSYDAALKEMEVKPFFHDDINDVGASVDTFLNIKAPANYQPVILAKPRFFGFSGSGKEIHIYSYDLTADEGDNKRRVSSVMAKPNDMDYSVHSSLEKAMSHANPGTYTINEVPHQTTLVDVAKPAKEPFSLQHIKSCRRVILLADGSEFKDY